MKRGVVARASPGGLSARLHAQAGDGEPGDSDRAVARVEGALLERRGLQARGRGERGGGSAPRVPGALAAGEGGEGEGRGRLRDLQAVPQATHADRFPLRLRGEGHDGLLGEGELSSRVAQGAARQGDNSRAPLNTLRPGEADDIREDEGRAREGQAPGQARREAAQAGGQEGGGEAPQARGAEGQDSQDAGGERQDAEQAYRGVGRPRRSWA